LARSNSADEKLQEHGVTSRFQSSAACLSAHLSRRNSCEHSSWSENSSDEQRSVLGKKRRRRRKRSK
jgi:hypothetical protein